MEKNRNLLVIFLLLSCIANIAIHYLAGHPFQYDLFNSDALYLPTLFSDIFKHNGKIGDWYLTPAPYFFPDYLIFLLSYLVGWNTYIQIIAFSLFQTALTFAAVWFLARQALVSRPFFTAVAILTILTYLALTSDQPFSLLLYSAYHYGIFIDAIFFIALWVQIQSKDTKENKFFFLPLLGCIAFISTLSDNLFIVQLIVPLVATAIITSITERDFKLKNKSPIILVAIMSILGSISYEALVTNHTRYRTSITIDNLFANLNDIYKFFHEETVNSLIFSLLFISYIGIILYSFIHINRELAKDKKITLITIFSFFSLISTLGTVSITDFSFTPRYLIPVLSWPVLVVFIFSGKKFSLAFFPAATFIALLATATLCRESFQLIEKNGINAQYYPNDISCIDNILEKEHVNNGIAGYWDAKYIQNFSKLKLNIAQHLPNLDEKHWITSNKYFKKSYDFAIISENAEPADKISSEELIRLNGKPKIVKRCGSRLVYIYGKGKLNVK